MFKNWNRKTPMKRWPLKTLRRDWQRWALTISRNGNCSAARRLLCLPLLFVGGLSWAWDTLPHQRITRAALDILPKRHLDRFGSELQSLSEIYSILPDRYVEMVHYGFVRKSPGPQNVAEIRVYCVRPDGQPVHGATGDRESDTVSLVFLLERIAASLAKKRAGEASRYAGVLAHFVEDSLSPPHAVDADVLLEMTPKGPGIKRINVHSVIERSVPDFALSGRSPRALGGDLLAAATVILDQCYEGAAANKRDLPSMVKAAAHGNEQVLNEYRLRAGKRAAEILADALYTVFRSSDEAR
ncbi:MAG TPA: hypothetical protein VFV70_04625 [Hyphomonadaceae bacterium]|nr:hypothetical protein [Hyphomonadaceae bacterium]